MSEKEGTESIKKCLLFLFATHNAFELAKADGKINLMDAPLAMDPMIKLFGFISEIKKLGPEVKDISVEEKAELKVFIKDNYDIADDVIEAKVEKALDLLVEVGYFLGAF